MIRDHLGEAKDKTKTQKAQLRNEFKMTYLGVAKKSLGMKIERVVWKIIPKSKTEY